MSRHLTRLLAVLTGLIFLAALGPAAVALPATAPVPGGLTEQAAVDMLRAYNIVRGDPSGALHLDQKLTRAQAATVFVRARGAEQYAKAVSDLVPFYDASGHWAAGEITMTERLGLMRGDGNGGFRPDADITYAEVLTVLLRLLDQEPKGDWPGSVMAAAAGFGIVPPGTSPMEPALRGKMFWALAMTVSRLPLKTGETILQKHLDSVPPDLQVTEPPSVVTGDYVMLKGLAANGAVSVTIAGKPASLASATGQFSGRADLNVGLNQVKVEAVDMAGNKATALVLVERRPPIARVEVAGPAKIPAGASTKLDIKAFYAQNVPAPLERLEAQVTGGVAAFDAGTSSLIAGTKLGKGTLTLSGDKIKKTFAFEVTGPSPRARQLLITGLQNGALTANRQNQVKVQVLDENGALVADDNWRPIALAASGLNGLTITPDTAMTQSGEATFTVTPAQEGATILMATAADLVLHSVPADILSATRVVLTATPSVLTPDGTATAVIRAALQDEFGKSVANTSPSDIRLQLIVNGSAGTLANPVVTIRRGTSSAEATFRAGITPDTAVITGAIQSGQGYSVQPLTLPVTGAVQGARLQVTGPTRTMDPAGDAATITVRVVDAQDRLVTTGSYAFQFSVSASNGEPVSAGMPAGVQLVFPETTFRPVDDGYSAAHPMNDLNAVVGRTQNGTATVQLRYDKSGTVTLTPRLVGPTVDAYHNISGAGPAVGTTGMSAQPISVQFAAAPSRIELTVDSAVGQNLRGGALTAGTATVRARVVDRDGRSVPGFNGVIILHRGTLGNSVTEISGVSRKAAVNGIAEFTVQVASPQRAGFDLYTAGAGTLTSNQVSLGVRDQKAVTPVIAAIRGVADGNPSPTTGYIGPADDYMDIQLERQDPPTPNEPSNWVSAKVFLKGVATPLVTGAALDLKSEMPVIRVPKQLLPIGLSAYQVVINNSTGDTGPSPDWGMSESMNTVYNTAFTLSSALLDAATGRLELAVSGLVPAGRIAVERLALVVPGRRLLLDQPGVTVDAVEPARVVMTLPPEVLSQISPDTFAGPVVLQAQDGWFVDGSRVARAFTAAPIRPMAGITHAVLDEPEGLLHLYGGGFTHGSLSADLIRIHRGTADPVPLRPGTGEGEDRVTSLSDSQVTIRLSPTTLNALLAMSPPEDAAAVPEAGRDFFLTAEAGWVKRITPGFTYNAAPIRLSSAYPHLVFGKAAITSTQWDRLTGVLTFSGSGFSGSDIRPDKLEFRGTRQPHEPVPVWSGTGEVRVLSDSSFTMTLSSVDAANFDAALNGRDVFVNTAAGWLVDFRSRSAARIPQDSVVFTIPKR